MYIHTHKYIYTHAHICMCVYAHLHTCIRVIRVCLYVCMFTCACLHVHMYVDTCQKSERAVPRRVPIPCARREHSRGRGGAAPACGHRRAADTGERPRRRTAPFPAVSLAPAGLPAGRCSAEAMRLFDTTGKLVKIRVSRSRIPVKKNVQCFAHPCPYAPSLSKGTNPFKKTKSFLHIEKYQDKFLKLLQLVWEDLHVASLTEISKTMLEKLRTVLLLSKGSCGVF